MVETKLDFKMQLRVSFSFSQTMNELILNMYLYMLQSLLLPSFSAISDTLLVCFVLHVLTCKKINK